MVIKMQKKKHLARLLCGLLAVGTTFMGCAKDGSEKDTEDSSAGNVTVPGAVTMSEEDYAMYSIADTKSAYPDIPYVMQFTHGDGSVGDTVTYDEFRYYQLLYKNYFDEGNDQYWTVNPEMKTRVVNLYNTEILRNHAAAAACAKYGIALTEEEIREINYDNAEMAASFGSMDYFLQALDVYHMSAYYYDYYSKLSVLYEKLRNYYLQNGVILTEEADIRAMLSTDVFVHAKHILIMNNEGDTPEENRALADSILEQLKNGEDFDTLMNTYSEDTGLTAYPDGYYFFHDEMDEAFADAAFALKDGEMSEVVESSYGYHIILRCQKEDAYIDENFDSIKSTYQSLRFYEALDAEYADWTTEYCENFETYSDWHYAEQLGSLYTHEAIG